MRSGQTTGRLTTGINARNNERAEIGCMRFMRWPWARLPLSAASHCDDLLKGRSQTESLYVVVGDIPPRRAILVARVGDVVQAQAVSPRASSVGGGTLITIKTGEHGLNHMKVSKYDGVFSSGYPRRMTATSELTGRPKPGRGEFGLTGRL